jgi:MurNAc alpha-1-phosphate uridylyltransferase
MKAMVLAAGRGERMRPLTDQLPKPLLTVAGKPLIAYHLEALRGAGVRDIVINLSWLGSKIRDTLGDGGLVLVPNPSHHPKGDFAIVDGNVIERETDRFTYSGIGLYRPEFFHGCSAGRFPLLPLLKRAIAAGRARGQVHRGEWLDVGSPERLAELDARVRS